MDLTLSNRLAIIGLLAITPAIAQVTTLETPRQHVPLKFHGMRDDGTLESENWSGFAVTGSSFTQAKGSWTVPTVN